MFGGIPLFSWIMFGFVTRNKRCRKFETRLNESRSRDELEQVALGWEYSLMLRLLGPHQGIRLERLRAELDDHFEKYETSFEYMNEDQTQLVEKAIPEIRQTIETEYGVGVAPVPIIGEPSIQQHSIYSQPTLQTSPEIPNSAMMGAVGADGYEWISHNGFNYYRLANSGSEWTLWSE
jgi:hypothetical protein